MMEHFYPNIGRGIRKYSTEKKTLNSGWYAVLITTPLLPPEPYKSLTVNQQIKAEISNLSRDAAHAQRQSD